MPERRDHREVEHLLRRLDEIQAPDRWAAALDRSEHPSPGAAPPSPFRRVAIIAVALVLAAAGLGLVETGFHAHPNPLPAETVGSSALVLGGRLRCGATLPASLDAGHDTGMRFTLTNVTDRPVKASFEDGSMGFVLTAADGTVYDSRYNSQHSLGGYVAPVTIAPHASYRPHVDDVRVRWGGPLALTPECLGSALPSLHAGVRAAGPPTSDPQAIDLVVVASAPLLEACRPTESAVPVVGQIDPPSGSSPSMPATCSITVRPQGDFSSAQVLIVSPPGLSGVSVKPPYEDEVLGLAQHQTAEVVSWDFVVTRNVAIPVYSYLHATWPTGPLGLGAGLGQIEFRWTGSRWLQEGRRVKCGSSSNPTNQQSGSGGGGSGTGVVIPITWPCP
jgi:hypothetical protein